VEYYAARMVALDAPVSLETNLAALKRNGRTEEMLKRLGEYEQLRLGGTVPKDMRERLRTGEWHLTRASDKPAFSPIRYDVQRVNRPGELPVTNTFGAQPIKFRLQVVPALAPVGDKANLTLLHAEPAAPLNLPTANDSMPGAPTGQTSFPKPMDLLHHRALAVRVRVDGPAPVAGAQCAVLNVQLEAAGKTYRDHYIDLNFAGEKTIVLPEPTTERMLPEFRPAHANYAFKAAMYGFDYRHIVALNLRWMRVPKDQPVKCSTMSIEALAESEAPLQHPELTIGDRTLVIPADLKTGDYAEFWAEGPLNIFNRNGRLLSSFEIRDALPMLQPGENRVTLRAAAPAPAKLTCIATGDALSW